MKKRTLRALYTTAANRVKTTFGKTGGVIRDGTKAATDTAASAGLKPKRPAGRLVNRSAQTARETASGLKDGAKGAGRAAGAAGAAVAGAAAMGAGKVGRAGRTAASAVTGHAARGASAAAAAGRRAGLRARGAAADLASMSQGALAGALGVDLNAFAAKLTAGPATIYDRAMDPGYLATSPGGANHRIFDGDHTLAGAFKAVPDAAPDDTVRQEAFGCVQRLFRDVTMSKGSVARHLGQGHVRQGGRRARRQAARPAGAGSTT